MLFARFEDEEVVGRDLLPAFQSYVQAHLQLIQDTKAKPSDVDFVLKRQKAYDTYSAERDPATGLFTAMFGDTWAQDFVHDLLFSMSESAEGSEKSPSMSSMGGPLRRIKAGRNKSQPDQDLEGVCLSRISSVD
jgi:hypothetical protein